jgi:predicted PurR-regulated permease PerM
VSEASKAEGESERWEMLTGGRNFLSFFLSFFRSFFLSFFLSFFRPFLCAVVVSFVVCPWVR